MVVALAGCGGGGSSPSPVIATQTAKWVADSDYVRFMTNDAQYYGQGLWRTLSQSNESVMTTVTASVVKTSGYAGAGSGIIFCYQGTNDFYRLLIDPLGHYTLASKVGGTYTTLIPWSSPQSSVIHNGYGVENVISVTQVSPNNFSISFNGMHETDFTESHFTGGEAGFYISISSTHENFPAIPEDVRFKLASPAIYPVAAKALRAEPDAAFETTDAFENATISE
jgi:hypothetical protein